MSSPVAMRLRLRVELKRLRVEAGLTQKHVADTLDWSPSKLIRIENGQVAVGVSDLRALSSLYGSVDDQQFAELERLARGSKRMPFSEYRDVVPSEGIKYWGYEGSAAVLRQVQPLVFPGLLQTEEYTRGVLALRDRTEEHIDRLVQSRRERQEVLDHQAPPLLHFILDEGVLHRRVNGPNVLRGQLQRVLELLESGRISVQILPFDLGYHEALRGPFAHLEFGIANEADIVYIESDRSGPQFYEDLETTGSYKETFYKLEDKALQAADSAQLMRSVIETLP